jgi:hypothetical protein
MLEQWCRNWCRSHTCRLAMIVAKARSKSDKGDLNNYRADRCASILLVVSRRRLQRRRSKLWAEQETICPWLSWTNRVTHSEQLGCLVISWTIERNPPYIFAIAFQIKANIIHMHRVKDVITCMHIVKFAPGQSFQHRDTRWYRFLVNNIVSQNHIVVSWYYEISNFLK